MHVLAYVKYFVSDIHMHSIHHIYHCSHLSNYNWLCNMSYNYYFIEVILSKVQFGLHCLKNIFIRVIHQRKKLIQRFYLLVIRTLYNISITLSFGLCSVIWLVHPGTASPGNHRNVHPMTFTGIFGAPGSRCKVISCFGDGIHSTAIKLAYI